MWDSLAPFWYNTHFSWSKQFLNYKTKFGFTFFFFWHHIMKVKRTRSKLQDWINESLFSDQQTLTFLFFFKLDSLKMWLLYKHTKAFLWLRSQTTSADTLITNIFRSITTLRWLCGLLSVKTFSQAYKWNYAFHTPTVCYTNQIWPTHTHLPFSGKCSCLPSFSMQGLVKVETVSEESE